MVLLVLCGIGSLPTLLCAHSALVDLFKPKATVRYQRADGGSVGSEWERGMERERSHAEKAPFK